MSQNQFEDFLKDKSEEFSLEPDPKTWAGIQDNLPPEKKKKKLFLLWLPAIAACFVALWFYIEPKGSNNNEPSAHNVNKLVEKSSSATDNDYSNQTDSTNGILIENANTISIVNSNSSEPKNADNIKSQKSVNFHENIRDDDSRFFKTCKRSVLNFPFLNPSVEHSEPLNNTVSFKNENLNTPIQPSNSVNSLETSIKSSLNKNPHDSLPIQNKDTAKFQFDIIDPEPEFNYYFYAEFMPHFSMSRIGIEKEYKNTEPYASDYSSRKTEDKGRVNTCFSIGMGIKFDKRHSLSIGLRYTGISHSMTVFNVDNSVISGIPNRYTTFDYSSSDSFRTLNSFGGGGGSPSFPAGPVVNRYSYIGIPVTYGYNFKFSRKLNIGFNAGIIYNRLYRQSGIAHQERSDVYIKSENGSVMSITKHHLSGQLGLLLNYSLNSRSNVYMQVNALRSLNPIERDIVKTGYNSIGLNIGYAYLFGKK